MSWIVRYKRAFVLALGILFAVLVGTASAYFTAQTQIPDNVIRAGTVDLSSIPATSALSIDGLAPGGTSTRTLMFVNDGTLVVDAVVTGAKKMGITDFYNSLTVRVLHGEREVYDGAMSALRTLPVTVGAGKSEELSFEVGLPATAGNDLEGDYVRMTIYVDAEQTR
jgi:predicted ribosomally synthesized peptide with SipW-like signal peptide